jgi:Asp-tRNA(Asn)/Glu-tRNA(Gln) amidotransferase C subunit
MSAAAPNISPEQAGILAVGARLALSPERLEALATSFSGFLTGFEKIRALDVGDREPDTLTHAKEGSV